MKLTLTDASLLPDLLAFLRSTGCVAYYEGGGIIAVRPHSFGAQEAKELRAIVKRWWGRKPRGPDRDVRVAEPLDQARPPWRPLARG